MGDPGWFMGSTEVEVPEKYFTREISSRFCLAAFVN